MTPIAIHHIQLDERGGAWIDDTNIKVVEVVLDHLTYGWSAPEIRHQHDDRLTLSQIHAALAYYPAISPCNQSAKILQTSNGCSCRGKSRQGGPRSRGKIFHSTHAHHSTCHGETSCEPPRLAGVGAAVVH
ncbi:MAG: DUF433 domain-containing protein [Gemmataceae bacterium]